MASSSSNKKMLINISCLVQIIQNNAGQDEREQHPQNGRSPGPDFLLSFQWISCGHSAWQDWDLSARQALGSISLLCVGWFAGRCINICVNLSFFVVYEYLNLLQCQLCQWNFHATSASAFCRVFAEMWWLLVVQIEIPVLTLAGECQLKLSHLWKMWESALFDIEECEKARDTFISKLLKIHLVLNL